MILRVTNSRPRRGDSWLNRMPERGVQVVALAVVDRDPVAVDLGHAVGRARVERRRLASAGTSTTLPNISLRARPGRSGCPGSTMRMASSMRVTPRPVISPVSTGWLNDVCTKRLGGQVVDLVGPVRRGGCRSARPRRAGRRARASMRSWMWAMRSKLTVLRPADHADHLVALVEQQLGQVGAVLAGDAGDERTLGHGRRFYLGRRRCLLTGLAAIRSRVANCAGVSPGTRQLAGRPRAGLARPRIATLRPSGAGPSRSWPSGSASRGSPSPTSRPASATPASARSPCSPACSSSSRTSWWRAPPTRWPRPTASRSSSPATPRSSTSSPCSTTTWLARVGRSLCGRARVLARVGRPQLAALAVRASTTQASSERWPTPGGGDQPPTQRTTRLSLRTARQSLEQVGERLVDRDLRAPIRSPCVSLGGVAPQHGDVDRAEQLRVRLEAHRPVGQRQQPVGQLLDGEVVAGAHVVDLARLAGLDEEPVGPHHVTHVGEVAAGRQVADGHDVAAVAARCGRSRGARAGATNLSVCPGPRWLNARTRSTAARGRARPAARDSPRRPCWPRTGSTGRSGESSVSGSSASVTLP